VQSAICFTDMFSDIFPEHTNETLDYW